MARYAVHFEFESPVEAKVDPRHELDGNTLEAAKLQAAILYAVADFGTPPKAYQIFRDGETEVYRYPEIGPGLPRLQPRTMKIR
jgi:hypothetical protein